MANKKDKHPRKKKKEAGKEKLHTAWILVIGLVVVIPLIHLKTTVDPVSFPRFTALAVVLLVLTIGLLFNKKYKPRIVFRTNHPLDLLFIAQPIMLLIAWLFAQNRVEGLPELFKWVMLIMVYVYAVTIFTNNPSSIDILLKGFIVSVWFAIVIGVLQFFNQVIYNDDPNALYEIKGLMAHKNQYSFSLFLLIPFLAYAILRLKNNWRMAAWSGLAVVVIFLVVLQTRAVWIATIISVLLCTVIFLSKRDVALHFPKYGARIKRILVVGSLVFFILFGVTVLMPEHTLPGKIGSRLTSVFNPKYTSNEWRLEMWQATMELIEDHPVLGVGTSNWKFYIYPYYSKYLPSVYRHWRNPHNDYLQRAAETGSIGVMLYIALWLVGIYICIRTLFKTRKKHTFLLMLFTIFGISGYMVISFFSFPGERINHLLVITLLIALAGTFYYWEFKKERIRTLPLNKIVIPVGILLLCFIYYGYKCTVSEVHIAQVQVAKKKNDWKVAKHHAALGYTWLAPTEPATSYPIIMYKGLAAFHADKDYKQALIYFEEALSLHPTQISALNNIGSVYAQTGLFDSSRAYYRKALEIFPHYEFGLINIAKSYYMEGNYLDAYHYVLACDPNSTKEEINFVRGEIEKKLLQIE